MLEPVESCLALDEQQALNEQQGPAQATTASDPADADEVASSIGADTDDVMFPRRTVSIPVWADEDDYAHAHAGDGGGAATALATSGSTLTTAARDGSCSMAEDHHRCGGGEPTMMMGSDPATMIMGGDASMTGGSAASPFLPPQQRLGRCKACGMVVPSSIDAVDAHLETCLGRRERRRRRRRRECAASR